MTQLNLTGYRLTFSEEFNTRSISQTGAGTTWSDIRDGWRFDAASDIGFGHSSFLDAASGYDPFNVHDGMLTITARQDKSPYGYPGSDESGIITTQHGFSQLFGYFEMRADLNDLPGGWDAFWLLPTHQTPDPNGNGHQEIDVIEHYGTEPDSRYVSIHTTDDNYFGDNSGYEPSQVGDGFHTYGVQWTPESLNFYFDGDYRGSRPTPSDMQDTPMFMLANLATNGAGVALTGHDVHMNIDYIRAFSDNPFLPAVGYSPSAPDGQDPGLYGATAASMMPKMFSPSPFPDPNYGGE